MGSLGFYPVGLISAWMTYWSCANCWTDIASIGEAAIMCKVYFASSVMKYAPHRFAGTPALHAYIESYLEIADKHNGGRVAILLDIYLHMRRNCYYILGGHNSDGQ